MNRKEAARINDQANRLMAAGFTYNETETLRRISMTLHRWYEMECGDSNNYCSWSIERDPETDKPYRVIYPHASNKTLREAIPDREYGAIRRLDKMMPDGLTYYRQTDPRGICLYIIRPGDIPEGKEVDAYYTNGIAVY